VTNAIVHARTAFDLRIEMFEAGLRVEVHDGSQTMPTLVVPALPGGRSSAEWSSGLRARARNEAEGPGRWGLRIVDELSSRWGAEVEADGKTVWFELLERR
jgi:hypothetical protein